MRARLDELMSAQAEALVMDDPAVSFWVKQTLRELGKIDPVDAAADAELVAYLMRRRAEEAFDRASTRLALAKEGS